MCVCSLCSLRASLYAAEDKVGVHTCLPRVIFVLSA